MDDEQPSSPTSSTATSAVSRRRQFLEMMDATIPWVSRMGMIEPHSCSDRPGKTGPSRHNEPGTSGRRWRRVGTRF